MVIQNKNTTFKKKACKICQQEISIGGAAYTSHMRMHVKKKEAIEFKRGGGLLFMSESEHQKYIDENPYAFLGQDPLPGQPKGVWQIPDIATDIAMINPAGYFTTSGEAVKKADKLVSDLYSAAVKAKSFRDKLKKCRGAKKYLETARENGRLLIKCKDPKRRDK